MNEELRQILLDIVRLQRMILTDVAIVSRHVEDYPKMITEMDTLKDRIRKCSL